MTSELRLKQKSKNNKMMYLLVPVLVVVFLVCSFSIIAMQVEISQKNAELISINNEITRIENENKLLSRYSKAAYRVEYIESIARDELGYALPEERVYYIIPAD